MSLERLMELDIEILVEGHGHIHTLRSDIPDFPGVVVRRDPKIAISQKLDYMRWLREHIRDRASRAASEFVSSKQVASRGDGAPFGRVARPMNASGF